MNIIGCDWCQGLGEKRCPCCKRTERCRHCNGTGFDDELVDSDMLVDAIRKLRPMRSDVIDSSGRVVGVWDGKTQVLFRDFVRGAIKNDFATSK